MTAWIGVLAALAFLAACVPQTYGAVTISEFTASTASTVAGAHPDGTASFSLETTLVTGEGVIPAGGIARDINITLPPGLVGIAQNVPQCPVTSFRANVCSAETQIGTGTIYALSPSSGLHEGGPGQTYDAQVYNLATSPDSPVMVGVQPDAFGRLGQQVVTAAVHAADHYQVTLSAPETPRPFGAIVTGVSLTLWGIPSDPSHDAQRACRQAEYEGNSGNGVTFGCESDAPRLPFVENPTSCSEVPVTTMAVNTYEEPELFTEASFAAPIPTGCGTVPFAPSLSVAPDSTEAGAPTGFAANLTLPQNNDPYGQGTSDLRDTVVTLPEGLVISPSAASSGLQGCSDEQFGAGSDAPAGCPAASQIGTVEVITPLLSGPLTGKLYLGIPLNNDPTSGEMFRIFVEFKGFGQDIKLVSSVVANPQTGQLTGRFLNLPELPFNEVRLHFNGGPNGVLVNPSACGPNTTTSVFTPYSGGAPATNSSTFQTSYDGGGAPCPASLPFDPGASISTASSQAGALSPATLSFSREDGTQPLGQITAHLPAGLLGDVATVALCDPADAAAGTCPAASRIGTVSATAGAGTDPLTVPGTAYLARGTRGYQFAVSVVVPAVAGPYNLGDVVVLVNIQVNSDGSLTALTGPLPSIIDGIPLDIRTVTVALDRPGFTFNPTSCSPKPLTGLFTSLGGAVAPMSAPFQVSGCQGMPFKPSFRALTQAHVSKVDGASLEVRVEQPSGESNIAKVKVELPKAFPSRLTTLQKACLEKTFAEDPAACPADSIVGQAIVYTSLLDNPLSGPAYFVSHGGAKFPELIMVLQGEGITIDLAGETFINGKTGITSSTFNAVPDVPFSAFDLKLPEGPYSALGDVTGSPCTQSLKMPTTITAQNGTVIKQATKIAVSGCRKPKPGKQQARAARNAKTKDRQARRRGGKS
jgi:hypothetical protein